MEKYLSKNQLNLTLSSLFLALCLLLPLLTGQIPEIGGMLSPMHIPVLLCGFVCGWQYGLAVGLIAPGFRYLLFGMPPVFPTGVAMTFELAVYGLLSGLLYKLLKKKVVNIYITLAISMLAGRLVWGLVMAAISGFGMADFGFSAFLAGAFTNAVPGIILHVLLIPPLVAALKRAGMITNA